MSGPAGRRTDRVCISLHLQAEGTDAEGKVFEQHARTLLINRNGGVIVLDRVLNPNQQISLRRQASDQAHRSGQARIAGEFGRQEDGYVYGIELVDPSCNLWGVEFRSIVEAEDAVARMLLECSYCRRQEVVYLNERELKGFEANRGIARHCPSCEVPSIWVQTPRDEAQRAAEKHAAEANGALKGPALKTRLTACIRSAGTDDELAVCEEMFSGGLSFRSKRHYPVGSHVEIAVPFQPGAANIFVIVRIVSTDEIAAAGLFRHTTEYERGASWQT